MNLVIDILRESFFMFWETTWALILGFGLSGMVQAFVSKEKMERVLGDHKPKSIVRSTGLGMASSSCSYAASAMAKSLFQKGADFISSMVFMFASTNLVIELGIVLVALMGWSFAAAEFTGGPIMIGLLVLLGSVVFKRAEIEAARKRLQSGNLNDHDHSEMVQVSDERQAELEKQSWSKNLTSLSSWADASRYMMADLKMLRRELAIGYLVAGVLSVTVSTETWNVIFLQGHGFWSSLQNVIIGPFIALISFVCSVGNIPMAAALWKGGISFGGVISFIFADLIALPLILIYRKYYGRKLAIKLLFTFWIVMSTAGLIVEGIFYLFNWIPETRPEEIVMTSFEWNYTSILNIIFLIIFASMFWLAKNRDRFSNGQESEFAIDPICGMQANKKNAPATAVLSGKEYFFCSDGCRDKFLAANTEIKITKKSRPN